MERVPEAEPSRSKYRSHGPRDADARSFSPGSVVGYNFHTTQVDVNVHV